MTEPTVLRHRGEFASSDATDQRVDTLVELARKHQQTCDTPGCAGTEVLALTVGMSALTLQALLWVALSALAETLPADVTITRLRDHDHEFGTGVPVPEAYRGNGDLHEYVDPETWATAVRAIDKNSRRGRGLAALFPSIDPPDPI